MRTQKGFPRARYFAKTLGIEENRYTRYERAEVEPSLTLINKICEVLQVSPNELLGIPRHRAHPGPGFGEEEQATLGARDPSGERHVEPVAWRLATEVVAVRNAHPGAGGRPSNDPLAAMGETTKLFQQLLKDPFNTVAGIVAEGALQALDPERKAELVRLVRAFTDSASSKPPGDR
jgi:transcriptional regulator with XRE-family HTH domain